MTLRVCLAAALCLGSLPGRAQVPEGRAITPWAVVANVASHMFYTVDTEANAVLAIDARTGAATRIATGQRPIALGLDASARRLYAVNAGSGDVSVIDTATDTVIAQPKTDLHPYAIAIDTVLHRVYVSNTFSKQLTVIDGATNTSQQLPLGSKDALLCDSARHRLYMMGYEDESLSMLDEQTGKVTRLPAVNHMWSMALEPGAGAVRTVSVGGHALLRLSPEAPLQTIGIGSFPSAVAVDGDTAITANYGDGTVSIARPSGVATVRVSPHPQALAVDPARHRAFVVDTHAGTVSVIDLRRARVIATLAAGLRPYAIAVDGSSHAAIVANYGSGGSDGPAYTLLSALP